jgi:hypothetical protein
MLGEVAAKFSQFAPDLPRSKAKKTDFLVDADLYVCNRNFVAQPCNFFYCKAVVGYATATMGPWRAKPLELRLITGCVCTPYEVS